MDGADAIAVIRRRWWVVALGLLLTIAAAAMVFARSPARYESQAQVLLLPPSVATDSTGRVDIYSNPYLQLDFALSSATDVMVRLLNTQPILDQIATSGGADTVQIARAEPDSGGSVPPVVVVTSSDPDAAIAQRTAREAVVTLRAQLASLQSETGSSRSLDISARVIEPPTAAEAVLGSRLRSVAGILGVGTILSFLAAFAAERIAVRRRRAAQPDDDAERLGAAAG